MSFRIWLGLVIGTPIVVGFCMDLFALSLLIDGHTGEAGDWICRGTAIGVVLPLMLLISISMALHPRRPKNKSG